MRRSADTGGDISRRAGHRYGHPHGSSWEFIMQPKRSKPPRWFVPAVVTGAVAAGAVLAALIASTME